MSTATFKAPANLPPGTHTFQLVDLDTGVLGNVVTVHVGEAITLNNPGQQEAGGSFSVTGSIAYPPSSPSIQLLLGGTALSGTATLSGSTFSYLVAGQPAGTVSLQARDTSTGVTSNAVSVPVASSPGASVPAGALRVGPSRQYATLAAAVAAASNSAIIAVDSGTYTNDFPGNITGSNVSLIRCYDGLAEFAYTQSPANKKSPFDVYGTVTLDSLEIHGVTIAVADGNNGAGVRFEGGGLLTLKNCKIHDNQNGVLTNVDATSDVVLDGTEIYANGNSAGSAHNIYVGAMRSLTIKNNSYLHDAGFAGLASSAGHNVKCRALSLIVDGSRLFGNSSDESNEIDMPNGGTLSVTNSFLQKSANSQNGYMIRLGEENGELGGVTGTPNAGGPITFTGNTVVSDYGGSFAFAHVAGTDYSSGAWTCSGNTAYGFTSSQLGDGSPIAPAGGFNFVGSRPALDTTSPVVGAVAMGGGGGTVASAFSGLPSTATAGSSFSGVSFTVGTAAAALGSIKVYREVGSAPDGSTSGALVATLTGPFTAGQSVSLPATIYSGSGTGDLVAEDTSGNVLVRSSTFTVSAAQQGSGGTVTPGTPGALPAISFKAANAINVGDPIRFGHPMAYSDVSAGSFQRLTATSGGQSAAIQVGGSNAWPDASLRMGSYSMRSPIAIAAGQTASFQLGTGTAALTGSGPTAAQLAAAMDLRIRATGGSGTVHNAGSGVTVVTLGGDLYELNINDVLANGSARDASTAWGSGPLRGYEVLDTGPVLTHWRVWSFARRASDGAYDRYLKLIAHVTAYSNGSGGIAGVDIYGIAGQPNLYGGATGATLGPANVTPAYIFNAIIANGSTSLWSQTNVTLSPGSIAVIGDSAGDPIWVAGTRSGSRPTVLPAHDLTYLTQRTRIVPTYDLNLTTLAQSLTAAASPYIVNYSSSFSPAGALAGYSGTAGDDKGDQRIGYLSSMAVWNLFNPYDRNLDTRQKGFAFNYFDYYLFWEDERMGLPLNRGGTTYTGMPPANKNLAMFYGQTGSGSPGSAFNTDLDPKNYQNRYQPLLEMSHVPSQWAVPYIRTGHPIFIELGLQQTMTMLASQMPLDCRDWPYGPASGTYYNNLYAPNDQQVRSMGWSTRQLGLTECFLPDTHSHRQFVSDTMDANAEWCADTANAYYPASLRTVGLTPYWKSGNNLFQPYMMAYFSAGVAMQAWREALSGTRPGFKAALDNCAAVVVKVYNESAGGTTYLLDTYFSPTTPSGANMADDGSNGFSSFSSFLATFLNNASNPAMSGQAQNNITSLPAPKGFHATNDSLMGNPTNPVPHSCFAESVAAGCSAGIAYMALAGVTDALTVYGQFKARAHDSSNGFSGPTWIYSDGNYGDTGIAFAHAVVPPSLQ